MSTTNTLTRLNLPTEPYRVIVGDNGEGKTRYLRECYQFLKNVSFYEETTYHHYYLKVKPHLEEVTKIMSIFDINISFEEDKQELDGITYTLKHFLLNGKRYEECSKGIQRLFNIVAYLLTLDKNDTYILIDDIELHLSLENQKKLFELFQYFNETYGLRFVITTHSPFVFDNDLKYYAVHVVELYR